VTLLDLMVEHLIERSEDPNTRSDDPQASMTRFGEGVVLVETFAALHQVSISPHKFGNADRQLPLPDLLLDARVALGWLDLTPEEKGLMNGWIKALVS
jgi:mediator of RNA polymerase II transcription subunit 5